MVRPAVLDDAAAIARVHVASWRTTYRGLLPDDFLASLGEEPYTDRWRRVIGDGLSRVFVVDEQRRGQPRGSPDEGVVGFASCGRERAGESGFAGELYAIYILDSAQRQGHGRELVRAVAGALREMKLPDMIVWVLRDNTAARDFYERLGGAYVRAQPITIGTATLEEVSYGWRSLDEIRY
jgi:ribosomal protein S18 acetylase RimI-like enzyme